MNASVDENLRRWLSAESQIADRPIAERYSAKSHTTASEITDSEIASSEIAKSHVIRRQLESRDREIVAGEALSVLMRALPEVRPRPGFADRVMVASGLEGRFSLAGLREPRKVLEWLFATREDVQGKPFQALAGIVMLLVGSAVAGLPSLVAWLGETVSLADMVSSSMHLFTLAAGFLATALTLGKILLALYDALLLVLISPPVMLGSLGSLIFTTFTLRWLRQLLSSTPPHSALSQRSDGYVPAHR